MAGHVFIYNIYLRERGERKGKWSWEVRSWKDGKNVFKKHRESSCPMQISARARDNISTDDFSILTSHYTYFAERVFYYCNETRWPRANSPAMIINTMFSMCATAMQFFININIFFCSLFYCAAHSRYLPLPWLYKHCTRTRCTHADLTP